MTEVNTLNKKKKKFRPLSLQIQCVQMHYLHKTGNYRNIAYCIITFYQ